MRLVEVRNWFARRRRGGDDGATEDHDDPEHGDAAYGDAAHGGAAHGDAEHGNAAGGELAPADGAHAGAAAGRPAVSKAASDAAWSRDRIDLLDQLCGEGHMLPGGDAEIIRLAAPLGLSAASSVLLLGAGLGGPARVLATDLGAWVTGYEADPTMVKVATGRLQKISKELAKRATVERWNPAAPAFKTHGFHHAIALDPIRSAAPEDMLTAISEALKPGGQLVLVQLTAETPLDAADPVIARWAALEHRPTTLPAAAQITRALATLGFDVRVVEDISSRHIRLTAQGWKSVVRGMGGLKPANAEAAILVSEAELWMRRLRLVHAGRLRLMRWHGITRAGSTVQ